MKTIFLGELRLNLKALFIWSIVIGGFGFICILLYESMQGDMKEMADTFSSMGAFSDAFGMSTLSIATLKGYFAAEVGTIHSLGSGMFAAVTAIGILSKEEEGHTGEFLLSLPITRKKVVLSKGLCVLFSLIIFTCICAFFYSMGFIVLDEELPAKEFLKFMYYQFLMNLEIAGICFGISSISGKNRMGIGIGIAILFYGFDLIGRIIPDLKEYLFLGPYSYANASAIFSGADTPEKAVAMAAFLTSVGILFAFLYYDRRDLAS